ncbi:LysR family transcriptional regulator [Roseibium aggregatum]|uniref:LysR family transcriptional regulator n=1 Tax=Roseibium aggregatum TaxID=187304 RepID=A0A939J753_9HYPH|nr:LysR family transcriptional regulator [Roseibium aggregatum]MBN9673980.1 LysR family transcriptional regulator [Roseibium aggregatum]
MDLSGRDLGLLASLDVLLTERSVTGAAKRLGISQPAMSAQLARLRELFGDELLVGNAHGMTPTLRAQDLHLPLRTALEDLRAVVSSAAAFNPETDKRHFRIAGTDLSHAVLMPTLAPYLASHAPGVTLEAVPLAVGQLADRMERGDIDFAISSGDNTPQDFPARKLMDENFTAVWRRGHPVIGETLTLDQFCACKHVVAIVEGSGPLDRVDEILRLENRSRSIGTYVPNFLLILPIVVATDMIAVVPDWLVIGGSERVRTGPLPIQIPGFSVYLSWHRRLQNDVASKWLRTLIVKIASAATALNRNNIGNSQDRP